MLSEDNGTFSIDASERWPLEPVYWTSPVTQNGRLVTSSVRVRVMEVHGNRNIIISRSNDNAYLPSSHHHFDAQTNPNNSRDMSSRDSPSSQLSEYSSPSGYSSPSHSPKMSRATTGSGNSTWNSSSKSTNRSTGGGPQRRRAPGFILRPKSQTIVVGERLRLKCSLLGYPKPTVTWEKDGELVDEDLTNGHIRTVIDGNDYQLIIEKAGRRDSGKYAVTARNSLGKQTASVDVVISDVDGNSADERKTDIQSPNGGVRRHQNSKSYHLNSNGKSSISKSYETTATDVSKTTARSPTSKKTESSTNDDQPSYRGGISKRRSRSNSIAPTFVQRLSSVQVLEGEELLLQCEVSADPDPLLEWRRNGVEVGIDEDEVFTSFRDGVARLRLRDVQPQHAGEYVCEAKNNEGSVQCSSRVTVKARRVEVRPQFTKSPSDIRLNDGDTLSIEAEVDGTPTPEIVWSLDGEELSGAETSYRGHVAKLTVHNVTSANSGQYMCSALNSRGEDSVACRVRVRRKRLEIPPEIIKHLNDVNIDENDDVKLRCVVTGYPDPTIEWMYNEEIITSDDGVDISYKDGVAYLMVQQATQEDSGCYTCIAENGGGRAVSRCRVIVQGPVEPVVARQSTAPEFLSHFDDYIRVQEGDSLSLSCAVSGYPVPEVTWTVNDRKVENGRSYFEEGKARLEISPIISNHGGHVKCQVTNPVGTESFQARIYVRTKREAPSFEELLPSSVKIVEGEEAYFQCKVTGHPQPRVAWSRDGRTLSVLSADTSYENGVAAVRIRKAGPRDAGLYACVARNLSGEAESTCKVMFSEKEEDAPKDEAPQFTVPLTDIFLEEGEDLKFKCHVTGDPRPKITWSVDGENLTDEDGDTRFEGEIASLVLADATPEDSGEYRCVAVNSAGRAASSCRVTVTALQPIKTSPRRDVAPSFSLQLEDKTLIEGRDLVLKCKVSGNPRPQVTWLLDGEEVEDAEVKYSDEGDAEFFLKEVLPEDSGVYTCIAENSVKKASSSCKVLIKSLPKVPMKSLTKTEVSSKKSEDNVVTPSSDDGPPKFIMTLKDIVIPDGSTNFPISCRVSGNPTARWFHNDEEIISSEDFQLVSDSDLRKLIFAEVFPDDDGEYTCIISNKQGEAKSTCKVSIEEIDGEAPAFLQKPKPLTVKVGDRAIFSCRADGDPPPSVQWSSRNQVIEETDRIRITNAGASNNYTYALEISPVTAQDAGKYSVCCSNLLGSVTCTISLIVDDVKRQEVQTDFRKVLKKSPSVKSPTAKPTAEENPNFRSVLRKASADKDQDKRDRSESNEKNVDYKQVLSTNVRTKSMTEEERKAHRAEQKDFRDKLVRKIDTKVVTQDAIRSKTSDQKDFRDEALKTRVQTKTMSQEDYRSIHAEQKDFRAETIKSKVVTKAYKEEVIKAKKAEQVDFRNVLSPTKRDADAKSEESAVTIANIPRAKWKKEIDHTTVSTRRARHKNAASALPEKKPSTEEPVFREPEFTQSLTDLTIQDGTPFELVCHVTGDPRPNVTWFFNKEKLQTDEDISITHNGNVCRLHISESFPEDQGSYSCEATNEHGRVSCSCYVTVLESDQ